MANGQWLRAKLAAIAASFLMELATSPPFPTGGFRGNVNMNALL